ncbi:Glycosyltransferase involved in cell wall bisynthesis [Chitinophaga sp. YR573]|uniref:glycosyltransferase family 4 protein n=1 Tax=Chitinophaga sp. YR573 TaxID=1881040 RepID=UPI0008BDD920|nr:glycosyltransferase family 4 protein [Chitinophaga sp. YR573]SEW44484.1 Glycosyltransferase involved in cell wall bisynthesis [Chitinophaga sp. YR573]
MRILKILDSNDGGGVFTCEMQFIKELRRKNVVVDALIVGDGEKVEQYRKICNNIYLLPGFTPIYAGSTSEIIRSIIASYKYGVKHSENVRKLLEKDAQYDAVIFRRATFIHLGGKLARILKTKSLWHLPSVVTGSLSRNYYNFYCKVYNIVQVANSIYTKNTLGGQCKDVVYPGFDSERLSETSSVYRQKLAIDKNVPVFGMAARMDEEKAQDIVVEAFIKSKIPGKGGHLLIAGGPLNTPFSEKVKKVAGEFLDKQIHILGGIQDMGGFYSSVDIIVNGRRNAEPFGISIAEALGAGKPIIAYHLGGPAEMIKDNINGWLVSHPTVKDYGEAMNISIDNIDNWPKMGQQAKSDANEFSVGTNVDRLMKIVARNGN